MHFRHQNNLLIVSAIKHKQIAKCVINTLADPVVSDGGQLATIWLDLVPIGD